MFPELSGNSIELAHFLLRRRNQENAARFIWVLEIVL